MRFFVVFFFLVGILVADTNATKEQNTTKIKKSVENNLSKEEVLKEELKKQMELEAKYAKEQKFYQGKDYNLKEKEVDEKTLAHIKSIEPDYDFDITDVYRDDQ